ncbi:hypothetical protein C1141_18600 [Vibrio agarivorans]|nr:hypothetical protein C1141_18600 [Vibrio agarivorans]
MDIFFIVREFQAEPSKSVVTSKKQHLIKTPYYLKKKLVPAHTEAYRIDKMKQCLENMLLTTVDQLNTSIDL